MEFSLLEKRCVLGLLGVVIPISADLVNLARQPFRTLLKEKWRGMNESLWLRMCRTDSVPNVDPNGSSPSISGVAWLHPPTSTRGG